MTALNFVQHDDQNATVVVDTLNNRGRHASKLAALPHLGALAAGRGRHDVSWSIFHQLMLQCQSFDEAMDRAESVFREILAALPAYDAAVAEAHGLDLTSFHELTLGNVEGSLRGAQTLLLVGWSEREGMVAALSVNKAGTNAEIEVRRNLGIYISEPHPEFIVRAREELKTDHGALQFMRDQHAQCCAEQPGYGGRALIARVSACDLVIRDLGAIA